MHSQVV